MVPVQATEESSAALLDAGQNVEDRWLDSRKNRRA
jgi:hypothetical protein